MKGIPCSPFYLQSMILLMGGFYLLAMSTIFASNAATNCQYAHNDVTDKTNNQHETLCVGNAITSAIFGVASLMTLLGALAGFMQRDIDIVISFVLVGVLSGYTSDSMTNVRLNCTAGDTSGNNMFPSDTWDSSEHLCEAYTYRAIGTLSAMCLYFPLPSHSCSIIYNNMYSCMYALFLSSPPPLS